MPEVGGERRQAVIAARCDGRRGLANNLDRKKPNPDPGRILLVFSLVLVLSGGFVYSCILKDHLRFSDESHYLALANNMINHATYSSRPEGTVPTAFHPPGYALILAALIIMKGGILSLRMLNFAALACCMLLLVRMLKRHGSITGAKWAPVMVLCYPVLFFTAGTLYPQTIATALFLLILSMLDASGLTPIRVVTIGMLNGLLLLISPNFILVAPLVLAMPYILQRSVRHSYVICIVAGAMLLLAPWVARNYLTFHRFVFLSTNGGKTFILGNSENSKPNLGESVDISKYYGEAWATGLGEIDEDQFYMRKALEWIGKNPQKEAKLYSAKFLNYFNYRNELATKHEQNRIYDLIMLATYYPLLILVLFRLCLIRPRPLTRFEGVLLLFYMMSAVTNALFLPRIRYRLPFDALLVYLAAFTLDHLKAWIGQKRVARLQEASFACDDALHQ